MSKEFYIGDVGPLYHDDDTDSFRCDNPITAGQGTDPGHVALLSDIGAANVSEAIHNADSKSPPVDADEFGYDDSEATFSLKKLTWANIKAALKTYFDTLYSTGAGYVPSSRKITAALDLSVDRDLTYSDVDAEPVGAAASAVSGHAGLTTGVHGVGVGTVAKTSDITATKLDDFTAPDDNTDLDASTSKHGLVLKATAPAAGLTNVVAIENGETAYKNKALFDATAPSTQAYGDAAAVGSAVVAARRDHKHAMPATVKDTTAITGVLKGNGSAISACSNLSDIAYAPIASPTFTGGIYGGAGVDFFPNGIGLGIAGRIVDRYGLYTFTNHHRVNQIPTNFTWQGSPFITPDSMGYANANDFLVAGVTSGAPSRAFLSKAITNNSTNWLWQQFFARVLTASTCSAGIRIDDGSDNNYVEVLLVGGGCSATLVYKYRAGGGTVNTSAVAANVVQTEFIIMGFDCVQYGPTYIRTIICGEPASLGWYAAIDCSSWIPAAGRLGYTCRYGANWDYGWYDWFYNTFT